MLFSRVPFGNTYSRPRGYGNKLQRVEIHRRSIRGATHRSDGRPILGSIDFSSTLKNGGRPTFAPGLLASANRGVLYVDEVNLLPAHLVDGMLDASASGINTVQREGVSEAHPAKFALIGTMNPEEGELRPQLLDRFGLSVDVRAPDDVELRCEVVRRRMRYERQTDEFCTTWEPDEREMARSIEEAQARLPNVAFDDGLLLLVSKICTELGVGSLRADITLYKAATALSAWRGRLAVEVEDVRRAAGWVLAHRRRAGTSRRPSEPEMNGQPSTDELLDQLLNSHHNDNRPGDNGESNGGEDRQAEDNSVQGTTGDDPSREDSGHSSQKKQQHDHDSESHAGDDDGQMQTFTASKPGQIKQLKLMTKNKQCSQSSTGRRNDHNSIISKQKTRYVRSTQTEKPVDIALDATLRAAAANGLSDDGRPIILSQNLRKKVYSSSTETVVIFVVDASGSMAARKRMKTVKGTVLALLTDAYRQRNRVGVISFRGTKAEVLLEPTRSVEMAERELRRLPTGGRTPLAHALVLVCDTVRRLQKRGHEATDESRYLLVVLSDGKANVSLRDSSPREGDESDAWDQTAKMAAQLADLAVPTLLLDTDAGHVRVGRGRELSELMGADYLRLEDLSVDDLVHTIRQTR